MLFRSGYCTQQVSLNVVVHKEFYFDLFSYCEDDSYFVEVRFFNDFIPNVKKIEWKINQTVISQFGLKVKLSDFSDLLQDENIISLTITDENDCVRSHEIKIIGKNYCKIQNGISPNGDGLNEYFDLASFGGVHLIISNRYGKEVYENKNYKVEWRGQSNKGNMLPSGTYFYQMKTNIGEYFTGWIQLNY